MNEAAATTTTNNRPIVERRYEGKPKPPKTPHTIHLRELLMPDGRRLLLDRRAIAFLCQAKPEEFEGKTVCIIAFKTAAKACPVVATYDDLKSWWHGAATANNDKAA